MQAMRNLVATEDRPSARAGNEPPRNPSAPSDSVRRGHVPPTPDPDPRDRGTRDACVLRL